MRRLELDFMLPVHKTSGGQKVWKHRSRRLKALVSELKGKLCAQKVRVISRKGGPDKALVALHELWPAFNCLCAPTCQDLSWSQVHLSPPTDFPR